MAGTDHSHLVARLYEEYEKAFPASAALHHRASTRLFDSGSHLLRLFQPFPFRIESAQGAWVTDVDGHRILDFWQGHYANILGHNPPMITERLASSLAHGYGLQSGLPDRWQIEAAEILCERTGAERVRFTTSGSLATMYAVLLARAFTGRDLVLKAGGGWHGAQPWALRGITYGPKAYDGIESEGLPKSIPGEVSVTRYNDPEDLRDHFRREGDRIACFLVEPWLGSGGFIAATPEYLRTARDLTHRYGALLILDEIISGFRFRAGDLGAMYGVKPDLATFGKIIGGGMPTAAVVGREEVMRLCSRSGGRRVRFDGGTYSAHPASMIATVTMLKYLIKHEAEIYPRIGAVGERIRRGVERVFAEHGILARCTGYGNELVPNSSLAMVHFPTKDEKILHPEQVNNPECCDIVRREQVLKIGLLLENVNVVHGLGAVSMAHGDEEVEHLLEACDRVAARMVE